MALFIVVGGICFFLGVVYPLVFALAYPFYRALGGRKRFLKYMDEL